MKTYLFNPMVLCMTLGALIFSACSDDDKVGTDPIPGEEAKISFTLTLPPSATGRSASEGTANTRADQVPTTAENTIDDIYIYVFESTGAPANDASNGRFGPFDLNDASQFTASGNTYTMVNPVTTLSGTKTIYVLGNQDANLPATTTFANESELLTKVADVHNHLIKYDAGGDLQTILFEGKTTQNLVPAASGTTNPVNINVERAVSRVIVTAPNTLQSTWAQANDMQWTITKYFILHDALQSYHVQNYFEAPNANRVKTLIAGKPMSQWSTLLRYYSPDYYLNNSQQPPYINIIPDPGSDTGRSTMEGVYIGENAATTPGAPSYQGNTTFAYVQTSLNLDNTAVVNGSTIEYTGPAIAGGTDDLHLVRISGVKDYLCTTTNSGSVFTLLEQQNPGKVTLYTYPQALVYYRVHLNSVDESSTPLPDNDLFNVYRNQFVHIDVARVRTDINAPGGFGSGYPGNPTDPQVPIDPMDKTDDNNPTPIEPEDPVKEQEAILEVNISVKPWTYSKNSVELQ